MCRTTPDAGCPTRAASTRPTQRRRPTRLVRLGLVHHRFGQPTLVLQREIRPPRQLGDGVVGEEVPIDPFAGHFPGDVLDAVLADVQVQTLAVIRPCTSRTVEAPVLMVHQLDRTSAGNQFPALRQHLGHTASRTPTGSRMVIILLGILTTGVGTPPHRGMTGLTLPEQVAAIRFLIVRHRDVLRPSSCWRRLTAVETVASTPTGSDRTSGSRWVALRRGP